MLEVRSLKSRRPGKRIRGTENMRTMFLLIEKLCKLIYTYVAKAEWRKRKRKRLEAALFREVEVEAEAVMKRKRKRKQ